MLRFDHFKVAPLMPHTSHEFLVWLSIAGVIHTATAKCAMLARLGGATAPREDQGHGDTLDPDAAKWRGFRKT